MTRLYTDAEIQEIKDRNPVDAIAGQFVTLRAQRGTFTSIGPCPLCSANAASRTAGRFECNADTWVCANCQAGGGVIDLVARLNGLDAKKDFRKVIGLLGGAKPVDDAEAARRAAERADKRRRQEEMNARYRERERKRLYENFWCPATPWQGSPVETYLRGRGLAVPPGARLRFHPAMPLFADGRESEPRLLHTGPAMLAAILAPNVRPRAASPATFYFSGLHITWLDPTLIRVTGGGLLSGGNKGKLAIVDPETGAPVPSKKVRGHKAGGYIDLGFVAWGNVWVSGHDIDAPACRRLIAGEGIETTLAVYTALQRSGHLQDGDGFRAGIDLGNLAGRALDRLAHPTLKDAAGRARRVPGRESDLSSPAMPVPETVRELILLGDGDSDPFTTQCAMTRAEARHRAEGRRVRTIWPKPGTDFNSMLQGAGQGAGHAAPR